MQTSGMAFRQEVFFLYLLVFLFVAHCFEIAGEDFIGSAHLVYDDRVEQSNDPELIYDVKRLRKHRALQTTAVGEIADLFLINTLTNLPITRLVDGAIINIGTTSASNLNIQATVTTNGIVGSVRFGYNATTNYRTESEAPFAFCGNSITNNYYPCFVLRNVGFHTVTATSYFGPKATGAIGSQKKVSFLLTNTSPTTPISPPIFPTRAPTKHPVSKSLPPSKAPSHFPTNAPTKIPTQEPTKAPSKIPDPCGSCNIPKFTTASWENVFPSYPFIVNEVQADLIQNDIVMSGGFINAFRNVTNHTYGRSIVNITTSQWFRLDDMPGSIGITHAATVVIGSKMYSCGGYVGPPPGQHTSQCFVYDHSIPPGSDLQWQTFVSLPNNGTAGGAMVYDSSTNTIFYTGGAQRPFRGSRLAVDVTDTWKISLNNLTAGWISSTPIPYQANHQSYVTVHYLQQVERHFVLGGQVGEDERNGNVMDMYEFNTNTGTWSRKENMPYPRGHTTVSSRAIGHCGFIIAGGSANTDPTAPRLNRTADIHYYHIPTDSWHYMGTLPQPMATPPVFIGSDNYMYFVARTVVNRRKFSFQTGEIDC